MESPAVPESPSIGFDDFLIDTERFTVSKNGEHIPLTPRAFDLLVFLIAERDRVIEKQELFDVVWKDTFVTDNALTRAIKEIRQALGDSAASPRYVETVHKRGYRFIGTVRADATEDPRREVDLARATESRPELPDHMESPRIRAGDRQGRYLVLLVAGIVVFGGLALSLTWSSESRISSIAVLPFRAEGESTDLEYLSDGMTESLIGALSQIPELTVKSRSSVFGYKADDSPIKVLGNKLGVEAVLTGRVVQRGDELTVYLSLVDTANENNLWSKQYSRKINDLVAIQNEIAGDVAKSVRGRLSPEAEKKIVKNYTESSEAYRLYLLGRYHVLSTRIQGAEAGISYYRQAIQIDPQFALAYAGLAEAAIPLAFRSELPPENIFPTAKNDAIRAIELDPSLGAAYVSLALINIWHERDRLAARSNVTRALEISPNSADAHLANGTLLFFTGQESAGLAAMRRAVEIDPLNLRNMIVEAQFLNFGGRSAEALEIAKNTLELNPNFYLGHLMMITAQLELGLYDEAVASAEVGMRMNTVDSLPAALRIYALNRSGKAAEAEEGLRKLAASADDRFISPYNLALAYNAVGETERAFGLLERALEKGDIRTNFLPVDPKWSNIRQEVRFKEILRRSGFENL